MKDTTHVHLHANRRADIQLHCYAQRIVSRDASADQASFAEHQEVFVSDDLNVDDI